MCPLLHNSSKEYSSHAGSGRATSQETLVSDLRGVELGKILTNNFIERWSLGWTSPICKIVSKLYQNYQTKLFYFSFRNSVFRF